MSGKIKILIIDDEPQIRRFLRVALEPHGYEVKDAETGGAGLVAATSERPDLVVLDLGLPDIKGFEVLKRLREWYERPVIILSVRDDEGSIVAALDQGADDYLTKPFGVGELIARMRVALRKQNMNAEPTYKIGELEVDIGAHTVKLNGNEVKLTSTEFSLLKLFVQNAGKVLTHAQILKAIWGPNSTEQVQYIRVYIGHLRSKIETDPAQPRYILTEPGVGYRCTAPPLPV